MAGLSWADDDGFGERGLRVASVLRFDEVVPQEAVQASGHGPGFFGGWNPYWEAYVRRGDDFELVVVDGVPGRWKKREDAIVAAESAHRGWVTRFGDCSTERSPEDRPRADWRHREVSGVVGHLRSLVRAWRHVHRSGPTEPRG